MVTLADIGAGIGRGVLGVGTLGISELARAEQEQRTQRLQQAVQGGGTPADAINRLAQIGTPEAIQYAKILADQSQLPPSVAEFQAVQQLPADQQAAYQQFKNPEVAVQREKMQQEQRQTQAAADTRFENALAKTRNVLGLIEGTTDDKGNVLTPGLKKRVTGGTAGLGGYVSGFIPGTEARDLGADIDTLKANLGFEELQAMRDASKTGGALGSVTENELKLLTSVKASLDQTQSPKQLKENLNRAAKQVRESWKRVEAAYRKDGGLAQTPQQASPVQGVPQVGTVEDGYRFKGGNPADPTSWEKQ